jgi:hypothetical protein
LAYIKTIVSSYDDEIIQLKLINGYIKHHAESLNIDEVKQGLTVFNYWYQQRDRNKIRTEKFSLFWGVSEPNERSTAREVEKYRKNFMPLAHLLADSRLHITYANEDRFIPIILKNAPGFTESGKPLVTRLTSEMCYRAIYKAQVDTNGIKLCLSVPDFVLKDIYQGILDSKRSDYLDTAIHQSKAIEAKLISDLFTLDRYYPEVTDKIRASWGKFEIFVFPVDLSTERIDGMESIYSYLMKRYTKRFFEVYPRDYLIQHCDADLMQFLQQSGYLQ